MNIAAQKVRSGWDQLIIAGGVECMSRVPMGPTAERGRWILRRPTTPTSCRRASAPTIATTEGFTREDVDAYAVQSQQRSAAAWSAGNFAKSVVPVKDRNGVTLLDHDEHMRPDTTMESLAKLSRPSPASVMGGFDAVALQKFHWVESINHVPHARQLLGHRGRRRAAGRRQRAGRQRLRHGAAGSDRGPQRCPVRIRRSCSPAPRQPPKALKTAGLTVDDIDVWELNDIRRGRSQVGQDFRPAQERSINGGAIAMGHPLGATGAMILGTVVDVWHRTFRRRYGLVTLCIGGGMGLANC